VQVITDLIAIKFQSIFFFSFIKSIRQRYLYKCFTHKVDKKWEYANL